jgi:hypothetical protein
MVEINGAFEAKLRGWLRETGRRDVIAEAILRPEQLARLGRDFELGLRAGAASSGVRRTRPVSYSDKS